MRLRSLVAPYALLVAAGLVAGCGSPAVTHAPAPGGAASGKDNPDPDIGAPLYTAAKPPVIQATQIRGGESLVIHSTAQFDDRQQVSADVDGKLELLATMLEAGTAYDKNDPNIVFHPRDAKKEVPYRRLSDGDVVKKDQVLCYLDDQLVSAKMDAATEIKAAVAKLQDRKSVV